MTMNKSEIMRVIHFTTPGGTADDKFLAIQRRDDPDIRIPVYKEEFNGVYRQTPNFFPSCLKFLYSVDVKFDKQMTAEEVRQQFGEINDKWPGHGLNRIDFKKLTKKQTEAYAYQKVSAILADYGFECTWLINDWHGADFLAVDRHGYVLKIQLKSGGYEINEKFSAFQDLWMLFRNHEDWYLIKHRDLVEMTGETTKSLESKSWQEKGIFIITRKASLPKQLKEALRNYKINGNTNQEICKCCK